MKKIEFLYLSQKDVIEVGLTMKEAIDIVEEVLTEHGEKRVENPPKPGIHPLDDCYLHAMPGYLSRKKAGGIKWVANFSRNLKYGLPNVMGLIVLNDVETGQPIAVMDGTYITALRTAAVSALAARFLARKDARVIGVVGASHSGPLSFTDLEGNTAQDKSGQGFRYQQ